MIVTKILRLLKKDNVFFSDPEHQTEPRGQELVPAIGPVRPVSSTLHLTSTACTPDLLARLAAIERPCAPGFQTYEHSQFIE